jgi:hypothetical protein
MFPWLIDCAGRSSNELIASCEGAQATMYGAYLQGLLTAIAALIALVAAILAYRGAMAPVRDTVKTRRVLTQAFAHRIYFIMDRIQSASYTLLEVPPTDASALSCKPLHTWPELDSANWKDQAQLGQAAVELFVALKAHIDNYNESVERIVKHQQELTDVGQSPARGTWAQYQLVRGKLDVVLDTREKLVALLKDQFVISVASIEELKRREHMATIKAAKRAICVESKAASEDAAMPS